MKSDRIHKISKEWLEDKLRECEKYHYQHQAPINIHELRCLILQLLAFKEEVDYTVVPEDSLPFEEAVESGPDISQIEEDKFAEGYADASRYFMDKGFSLLRGIGSYCTGWNTYMWSTK